MDKIIAAKSAEILKFSNIALILSYYDFPDQWRKVMKRLCKFSKEQWINHENAFKNVSVQAKRNVYITSNTICGIQWLIQNEYFFNKILFERDQFDYYAVNIAMNLKPEQILIMNLHADDTKYIELHFGTYKESNILIPSLKGSIHKPISKFRTESAMIRVLGDLNRNLDLYIYSIEKIGEDYRIKQMFSPIIKATAYSGETQENKELNIKSIYSGEKGKCGPHTIVGEYDKLSDANNLLSSIGLGDNIDHFIFELNKAIGPSYLDQGIPLHYPNSPGIEIKYKTPQIERKRSNKDGKFCVYLNKRRFKIRTPAGYYLIEMNSHNFVIGGNEVSMQSNTKGDWLYFKFDFIDSKYFKIKLSYDDFEQDYNKYLDVLIRKYEGYVIVKISDIYKIELNEISSIEYFFKYPSLTKFEINLNERIAKNDNIIGKLNELPRNLSIQINTNSKSKSILNDSEFCKLISEFKDYKLGESKYS